MTDPTFRLESVVRTRGELEDFEGPLTLILQLLSKNKIEIEDIKISLLLDQYMAYLDEMKSMDLEVASEFVAMASHLVYIKTRMLLNADEEITELQELITSLEKLRSKDTYARIKGVTDTLLEMYRRGAGTMTKLPETLPEDKVYRYVHDKSDILAAALRALESEDGESRQLPPRKYALPKRIIYSITEKAEEIVNRLHRIGVMRINALFAESRSRTELVATFVALLELCKAGRVRLNGDEDDYVVSCAEGDVQNEEIDR